MNKIYQFIFGTRDARIASLQKEVASLNREIESMRLFHELARKAAQMSINGYVMVGTEYLPEGKNCPLVSPRMRQELAKALGVKCEKWRRVSADEQRRSIARLNRGLNGRRG